MTLQPIPTDDSLTGGEIAGIVIAVLVVAAILLAVPLAVLLYLYVMCSGDSCVYVVHVKLIN